jgi:hypothetical protein
MVADHYMVEYAIYIGCAGIAYIGQNRATVASGTGCIGIGIGIGATPYRAGV